MRSDLVTTTRPRSVIELDGLSGGYLDDSGQGTDDDRASSRVIQGRKIKFTDPNWYLEGQVITGRPLTIIAMRKVVSKWTGDNVSLETQILLPNDPFPNFKILNEYEGPNAKCKKSEWFMNRFGKFVGPWQGQRAFYFIDENYNRYTWASPGPRCEQTPDGNKVMDTIGSAICCREIMDQIELYRRHKGPDVYPVTLLGHCDFKTQVGLKQRPDLLGIKEWVHLSTGRIDAVPAVDAAPVAEITAQVSGVPADAVPVTKPTAKEVTGDEIVF
jgi:hypothetical protein